MTDAENAGRRTVPSARGEGQAVPTRKRLLIGAAGLFREKGYAGTTTRALSALAGIQNGSLYYHVGGKEDLLYELCVDALKDVDSLFTSLAGSDGDPMARLEKLARGYVELALRDRDRHVTMLTEIRSLSPVRQAEVVSLRDQNVAVAEDLIVQAQQCGQIRTDIAAKYLTLALFNLLNWTIFWFDPTGELTEEKIAEILWSVYSLGTTGPGILGSISREAPTAAPSRKSSAKNALPRSNEPTES
jgi:TetR/AcrR family transcriptional regulator, cholesterol catabolism regulator